MGRLSIILFLFILNTLSGFVLVARGTDSGKPQVYKFVENRGQWQQPILFETEVPSGKMFLEKGGFTYVFFDEKQVAPRMEHRHGDTSPKGPFIVDFHALKVEFMNSDEGCFPAGENMLAEYRNYYLGKDPSNWASGVPLFSKVVYSGIYKGVDLELYSDGGKLKYDLILHKGAKPESIKIKYSGAKKIFLSEGKLVVETSVNKIVEEIPIAYQMVNGKKVKVSCAFVLKDSVVTYLPGKNYNPERELVIDPLLIFSTYSGASVDNFGFTATYDSKGNLYTGGISTAPYPAFPTGSYPTTPGAFQRTYAGGNNVDGPYQFPCDITISKYNASGSNMIYATYLGGSSNEFPHSLVADDNDNLLLMGTTYSGDFPVSAGAFDTTYNGGSDIIVTKFNPDGTVLLGSTFVGGASDDGINTSPSLQYFYADDFRGDIITDDLENVYVASNTYSDDFPVTAGVFQASRRAGQDGCVFKLNKTLTGMIWSSFMGGTGDDAVFSVDLDSLKNVYVSGGTTSPDFPIGAGGLNKIYQGGRADGIIAVINSDGSAVNKGTYIGTGEYDQIFSLERDLDNNIYVVGQTEGVMPVKGNVYANPLSGQFLMKLNDSLNRVLLSTVFGTGDGKPDITINAFLVDECGKIYVSGWGGNTSGNNFSSTKGLPVSPDAFQKVTDGNDFYLMVLSRNARSLLYATYFGGDKTGDHVDGGTSRFDKRGVVYQSVCASCPFPPQVGPLNDFPTTPAAYAPMNISPRCSNASFKFDFHIPEVAFDYHSDSCTLEFSFENKTFNASSFFWDFGDGATSKEKDPKHRFAKIGTYKITLIADPNTICADTTTQIIVIPDDLDKLVIPNVFTPNGDNFNDCYKLGALFRDCDVVDIKIFNRWGQLLFKTDNYNDCWNGLTSSGSPAPDGTYYYVINITRQGNPVEIHKAGTITLIR